LPPTPRTATIEIRLSTFHETQLVNTIGHSAGAIIFGIFLYLLLRDRSGTRLRGSWLSFAAAGLAFLWNIGALAALIASTRNANLAELIVFFCFAVLSLLPAVLLHLSLDGSFTPVIASGYALSAVAIGVHLEELLHPGVNYQRRALLLITIGFGILTGISVAMVAFQGDSDRRAKASRIFGAMCAALVAMSFVHLGTGQPLNAWSSELVLHHAGIPLALFVLLQDYRFVLLDAFVRFLANVLLAGVLTFAVIRIAFQWVTIDPRVSGNPLYAALFLVGICLLLILFALLRAQVQQWLTRVVFRRPDLNKALHEMQSRSVLFTDESGFLEWAAGELARFMRTERVEIIPEARCREMLRGPDLLFPVPVSDLPSFRQSPEFAWVEAVVPLRLAHGDVRYLLLGRRHGGRRYLSEDLQSLSRLTTVILEQVERFRNLEMQRLVSQAELRALQSQINPHFLFNALNTLYGIIPRDAAGARKTVLNLAEIFRYFLQSERSFIQLSEELEIVKAYLEIERLRLGPRLEVRIDVDEAALGILIPILSIQPLVENAIKHGLSAKPGPGLLGLRVTVLDEELCIAVEDNGLGLNASGNSGTGVGLANVKRRLQLCFGPDADILIDSSSQGTKVQFAIPLAKPVHA
jgi:two-component system LytT family sensor kinase